MRRLCLGGRLGRAVEHAASRGHLPDERRTYWTPWCEKFNKLLQARLINCLVLGFARDISKNTRIVKSLINSAFRNEGVKVFAHLPNCCAP